MRPVVLVLPILAALCARAAELTLHSPRLVVSAPDGTQLRSEPLSTVKKPSPAVTLGAKDSLRLTFQILAKGGEDGAGAGVQPHQTFLRFFDPRSGEEGVQPVRVSAGGKAKFELNMARPPLSLPPTPGADPVEVTLLVGSFEHAPLQVPLFDLVLPASQPAPVHPDEPTFHALPEIAHTFRQEQKLPPKVISAAFAAIVLVPWGVLLGLWAKIGVKAPNLLSPQTLPFTASLVAFEALLLWYWLALRLGQVLTYGAILAPITIYTGKVALVAVSERRSSKK